MAKILIVSHSHICRNPRTIKEAIALYQNGHVVTILTSIYSNDLLNEDLTLLKGTTINYTFYSDLRFVNLKSFQQRIVRKVATIVNAKMGIESKYSLGYGFGMALKMCVKHNADLYIMHQELPTILGCELLKKKFKVSFDVEDWYSEDLLTNARKNRPINLLKKAEKFALQNCSCSYTTSFAMANSLIDVYSLIQKPRVIYNSFNALQKTIIKRFDHNYIRLYWFSQTIGPGRGLEFFIKALALSSFRWDLTLRGDISNQYKELLYSQIHKKDKLNFKPIIENKEILSDMINYDIGLALEPNFPPNKNLTISNKFFHYLSAGIPIIASDTLGQLEIGIEQPNIIYVYKNNDLPSLITLLNKIGDQYVKKTLPTTDDVIGIFNDKYAWEIQSQKLVSLINSCI